MNSTALKKQLLELIDLKHPKTLYFFLDNDESGIHALNFFKTAVNDQKIVNMATIYHQFKDVNDWICSDNK